MRHINVKCSYKITKVNRNVLKWCLIKIGAFCWAVLWKLRVAMLFVSHFTALIESYSFVSLLSFGVCKVLFNVLSRSVFSSFRRGSLDEGVL